VANQRAVQINGTRALRVWIGILILIGLLASFGYIRWTGQLPYGSDDDEHLLVAQSLLQRFTPSVAGMEKTKYPFGYSLLLAGLEAIGLPVGWSGLALNWICMCLIPLSIYLSADRGISPIARTAAGAYVASNPVLWQLASSLRPDLIFVLLVVVMISRLRTLRERRDVVILALLSALATSLRSVGVLLGVALGVHLALSNREKDIRRWFWLPILAVLLIPLVQSIWTRGYPEHTTGYFQMLMLRDPYDASLGRASIYELTGRLMTRAALVGTDIGDSLVGPNWGDGISALIGVALVVAAIRILREERVFLISFVLSYGMVLAVWPYSSIRFGMPLVPICAMGLASVAGTVIREGWEHLVFAALLFLGLGLYVFLGWRYVQDRASFEVVYLSELHSSTADLAQWVDRNIPAEETIASFDYRELTLRLERPVLPMAYTSDVNELWAMSGGRNAEWLIVTSLVFDLRAEYAQDLINAFPTRFWDAYEDDAFTVYRIVG
jgi:hypothetical protein